MNPTKKFWEAKNFGKQSFRRCRNFFRRTEKKSSDAQTYAAEIFKARGFLLEDGKLILSDNSHSDDAAYLNELLTADNLGEVRDGKIFISPAANVEKIFYSKNISGCEAFSPGESWEKFVRDSFAPKVPVRRLEPFVARYVKAVSACGVATYCSCDGNHPSEKIFQRILIDFVDIPHRVWHNVIREKLLAKKFKLRWRCEDSAQIIFDSATKWTTYIELNRAAEFLYDNRLAIRKIRREASDAITVSMTRHLPADELAKIFSERAARLLDEKFY